MEKPVTPDGEKKATTAEEVDERTADPIVISMPVGVRSMALSVIAGLAGIIALQQAQSVLIPVVLGVLLSYALSPMLMMIKSICDHVEDLQPIGELLGE